MNPKRLLLVAPAASLVTTAALAQPTDAITRLASRDRHLKLKTESPFKDLTWRAVGPEFYGGRGQRIGD